MNRAIAPTVPATPWFDHLVRHIAVAREGKDPEGVHQLRVAAGRLSVWLQLGGWRTLVDDLRWLRWKAAAARDIDVVLASKPPAPWASWLRVARAREQEGLLAALGAARCGGALAALRLLPDGSREAARAVLPGLARAVLDRGLLIEVPDAPVEAFHGVRRALRRLRYGLEWLEDPTDPIRSLQGALGDLNDAAVALRLLDTFMAEGAPAPAGRRARRSPFDPAAHRARLEARLLDQRAAALAAWRQVKPVLEAVR